MNDIQIKIVQLNITKNNIEGIKKKNDAAAPANDGNGELSKKSQEWIEEHPRFKTDPEYRAMTIGGHNLALERGHKVDTKAYFDFVEKYLEKHMPDDEPPAKAGRRKPEEIPASSQSAPASRGATSGPEKKTGKIYLTAEQKEMAEMLDMSYEDYYHGLDEANKVGARK